MPIEDTNYKTRSQYYLQHYMHTALATFSTFNERHRDCVTCSINLYVLSRH